MNQRVISERGREATAADREKTRESRIRREMWERVLASEAGRYVLAEILYKLWDGDLTATNSALYQTAARCAFAQQLEGWIAEFNPTALGIVTDARMRVKYPGRLHEEISEEESSDE